MGVIYAPIIVRETLKETLVPSNTEIAPAAECAALLWHGAARQGAAPAPNACEWLARICSTSVLPERGMPTTNTGVASRFPASPASSACRRARASPRLAARKQLEHRLHLCLQTESCQLQRRMHPGFSAADYMTGRPEHTIAHFKRTFRVARALAGACACAPLPRPALGGSRHSHTE